MFIISLAGPAPCRRRPLSSNVRFHSQPLLSGVSPMMKPFAIVVAVLCSASLPASSEELCDAVKGAILLAQDEKNTYLGKISSAYDSESIFNEYATYGSEYNSSSIWNKYATFGSEYSTYSPNNSYTSTPPMIVKNKKIIGYLSINKSVKPSVSPNLLKAMCKDEM